MRKERWEIYVSYFEEMRNAYMSGTQILQKYSKHFQILQVLE